MLLEVYVPVLELATALGRMWRNRYCLEGAVHAKGADWHATSKGNGMHAVIDRVVDKPNH